MILIWGIPGDLSAEGVHTELLAMGAPVRFLEQTAALQTELSLSVGEAADGPELVNGVLCSGGAPLSLRDVTAVYVRAMDFRLIPAFAALHHNSPEHLHAMALEDLMVAWLEMTQARVVNRPSAMGPNNSKPYQAAQLRALGFATPRTLVTTDPQAARHFLARHRQVIYKSVSSVPSIVSRLHADDANSVHRMEDVANCPTQFQEFVPGDEYRVHTVGSQVFASQVISDADDYRHPELSNTRTKILPAEVPSSLVSLCTSASRALNLSVAGFDVRLAPDGTWYCFEVNPAPDFGHYQRLTAQPIATALAELLVIGSC
jgi:hypothetical protein